MEPTDNLGLIRFISLHQPSYNAYARKEPIAMLTAGVIGKTYHKFSDDALMHRRIEF